VEGLQINVREGLKWTIEKYDSCGLGLCISRKGLMTGGY
jgi:hypothetical protein